MREHTGGVMGDFVLVFNHDFCLPRTWPNRVAQLSHDWSCEFAFSRRGPVIIEKKESYCQSSFGFGHGRTRFSSSLRTVAPRCLSRENAGRTMNLLHHALWIDYFHQTPVSITWRENVQFLFWLGGSTQVYSKRKTKRHATCLGGG